MGSEVWLLEAGGQFCPSSNLKYDVFGMVPLAEKYTPVPNTCTP